MTTESDAADACEELIRERVPGAMYIVVVLDVALAFGSNVPPGYVATFAGHCIGSALKEAKKQAYRDTPPQNPARKRRTKKSEATP